FYAAYSVTPSRERMPPRPSPRRAGAPSAKRGQCPGWYGKAEKGVNRAPEWEEGGDCADGRRAPIRGHRTTSPEGRSKRKRHPRIVAEEMRRTPANATGVPDRA